MPPTHEEATQRLRELQLHRIELEMQNEELRRAQSALDASLARYFYLYELAPVGYVTLCERGLILEANLRASEMLGMRRGQLAGQPLARFIVGGDKDFHYLRRRALFETGRPQAYELCIRPHGAAERWVRLEAVLAHGEHDEARTCRVTLSDITERKRADAKLKQIEWLLTRDPRSSSLTFAPAYGDLSQLNRTRVVRDAVEGDLLAQVVGDYLNLLGTSAAIYEADGAYALGIFSSNWCRFMDQASRDLCGVDDNREALDSGKWLCHESCWTECSKRAIETGEPVDIQCNGGIRLYGIPVFAGETIVGSMNVGYGELPKSPERLRELAEKYQVSEERLRALTAAHEAHPPFLVEVAKRRLLTSAKLIGEIIERKRTERALRQHQDHLDQLVDARTVELTAANRELEAFSFSVSHDLRAPLRRIDGFSKALIDDYQDELDDAGKDYLNRLRAGTQRMGELIDDLLALSRLTRTDMHHQCMNLDELAREVVVGLQRDGPHRRVDFEISSGLAARGDRTLLKVALENLLGNAWKFTGKCAHARIELGAMKQGGERVYFVRDNGAGFDMTYVDRLFGAFQRLHDSTEFAGTGVGLAIVHRVILRHGGRIWAKGEVGSGATFYFTLAPGTPGAGESVEGKR